MSTLACLLTLMLRRFSAQDRCADDLTRLREARALIAADNLPDHIDLPPARWGINGNLIDRIEVPG